MEKISKIPEHIGIVISGNEEWARERNLPDLEGHKKGYEKILEAPDWFFSRGVRFLSFYLFPIEEWNRSREEVNNSMKLMEKLFGDHLEEIEEKGYKIEISGRTEELPGDLPEICQKVTSMTKANNNGCLNFCVNYGGRAELVDAVRKIIKNEIQLEQIHEGMIRKYLYNNDLPDVDLILNFSGKENLCGFQLWQTANSELAHVDDYWPEFEENDVVKILKDYERRAALRK